ncbi:16S rRNA (cytosine967-C5)-methyltransferase [Alkalibacterium subtropicum]|uniref:16S rRNA (cytosine(967)-C(5))-methyltransferase n=1 Tax=Alkalibacterium subtropicum TaxID=753702 RepID=A0A1I1ERB3_9LACT|nr:16S rRNA (cytosine(967)-C(5))-methyltransferase RsmB [Alkalibacterium subtropicum]SFB87423.1 16S rRNA (cytosine967-C5)-methyltransferase [Alkalibacterium subtropicum]
MTTNNLKHSSRYIAVTILGKIEKNQSFSNLLLTEAVKKNQLSDKDRGLLTELVYGVIQNKLLLDYQLEPFIKHPEKVENWVRQLLRLSLYQMTQLDKVPAHASVNEAVRIAKAMGHKGTAGFVNGVLRSIDRQGVRFPEEITDSVEYLSIRYSFPIWMIELLIEEVGIVETEKIIQSLSKRAKVSLRVNTQMKPMKEVISQLNDEGYEVRPSQIARDGLICENGLPVSTELFKKGIITIQDESSMLVAEAMQIDEGDEILDACAAPGGKTTHMASYLTGSEGTVTALDLNKNKLKKVEENAERLGMSSLIQTRPMDARKVSDAFGSQTFDKILVDAPCSGLGLMKRKPDIRYQKTLEDIYALQKVQGDILDSVAPLLKKGGRLIYSTCTITLKENNDVINAFLREHADFKIEPVFTHKKAVHHSKEGFINLYPHYFDTDGFFIASLVKY